MVRQTVPPRIRWAVGAMDVQGTDHLLEIGCGPGAAAEVICPRLSSGKLFCIDRSESGVDRTRRRNQPHVDSGRLTVRQIDLATLRVPVRRLDKAFAFNVNLFWVRDCADEVALLHDRIVTGGKLFLFYEAPRVREDLAKVVGGASNALAAGGFEVSRLDCSDPPVIGIVGTRV